MNSASHHIALIIIAAAASLTACEKQGAPAPTARDAGPASGEADLPRPAPAADNTARNKADRTGDAVTPMDQSQSSADVKITADIRRAIMDDSAMSMNAQNCKIITDKSGAVTLRGVVNSQSEKDSIEAKAKVVAGVTRVDNQLEIKAN